MAPDRVVEPAVPADIVDAAGRLLAVDRYPVAAEIIRTHRGAMDGLARVCDTVADRLAAEQHQRIDRPDPALAVAMRAFLVRCAATPLDEVFPDGSDLIDPQAYATVAADVTDAEAADRHHLETGSADALADAADAWKRVLAPDRLGSAYPGLRAALLNDAAGSALRRFWDGGRRADLDLARDHYAAALALTPPVSIRRISRLGNLAVVARETHERFGEPLALADAETLLREALRLVDLGGDGMPGAAETATNLALVLRDRALAEGAPDPLREAIALGERAIAASDAAGPRIMLGDVLGQLFAYSAEPGHLDRALDLLADGLGRLPIGSPERPRAMVDTAVALSERHSVVGDPADLDRGVELLEEARSCLPVTAPDRASASVQLALALYRRFEVSGRLDDLDRAIDLLSTVVGTARSGEVAAPTWRVNLATALIQRHRQTGDAADLDRAITTYEQLLHAAGVDRYAVTNNLGNALRDRARRTPARSDRDSADLDRAVELLRVAVELGAPGSARRAATSANLATAALERYHLRGDEADLRVALDAGEVAIGTTTNTDVDAARRWFGRATVLDAAARPGWPSDADDAYRAGCALGRAVDPESVLVAAQDWGATRAMRGEWTTAAEAYRAAVDATTALVASQLGRPDQETWLRVAGLLADSACYAAARAGDRVGAVEVAERCRAAMLSDAVGRDFADLTSLTGERPALAQRYRTVVGSLERIRGPDL